MYCSIVPKFNYKQRFYSFPILLYTVCTILRYNCNHHDSMGPENALMLTDEIKLLNTIEYPILISVIFRLLQEKLQIKESNTAAKSNQKFNMPKISNIQLLHFISRFFSQIMPISS